MNKQIKQTNSILKEIELPIGIEIIDINRSFLDIENNLSEIYTTDGVHLNEEGYKVLINLLEEEVSDINETFLN